MHEGVRAVIRVSLLVLAAGVGAIRGEDVPAIAGPPQAVDYAQDGPVRIRFSSYVERNFPGAATPGAPQLLNVPNGGRGENLHRQAREDRCG